MWLENLRVFSRTSIWRFTLIFTLIVLSVTLAVLAIVYHTTLNEPRRQMEASLLVAAQAYRDLSTSTSMTAESFIEIVDTRTRNSASLILSLDAKGKVGGNLTVVPQDLAEFPDIDNFPVAVTDPSGNPTVMLAAGTRFSTQFGNLVVGIFSGDYQARRQNFISASILALVVSLVLTLLAGLVFNWRVLRRLRVMGEFAATVKSGGLSARLPITPRGDEYDVISTQINSMLNQIDELVQSVAAVTDNIAHDLRTPLSRIRLRLEDSMAQGGVSSDVYGALLQDLDQLIETFESMLELSRLERGVTPRVKKVCDLSAVLEDIHGLFLPMAEAEDIALELSLEGPLLVNGDKNLLFRAFYNLVENALKYAACGDTVSLVLKDRTVCVQDNGPGIPEQDREKVFQRLYRLDASRNKPGSGLGLSIVRAIIDLHEASIKLESNHPGLRVTLEFP
ncbi:MAG: signal transduction histidine kinase [Alcanivorax sp.]|jgi:signal transduction histidine kinase